MKPKNMFIGICVLYFVLLLVVINTAILSVSYFNPPIFFQILIFVMVVVYGWGLVNSINKMYNLLLEDEVYD